MENTPKEVGLNINEYIEKENAIIMLYLLDVQVVMISFHMGHGSWFSQGISSKSV